MLPHLSARASAVLMARASAVLMASASALTAPRSRAASTWRTSQISARQPDVSTRGADTKNEAECKLLTELEPADWQRIVDELSPFTLNQRRTQRLEETLAKRRGGLHLVLENVADPFNAAAALRTAEGLGVQHVHVIESIGNFHVPSTTKANRGSLNQVALGASRWLSLSRYTSSLACFEELRRLKLHVVASDCPSADEEGAEVSSEREMLLRERAGVGARGGREPAASAQPIEELELPADRGLAVVFGNERRGVSRAILEHSDACFYLPMSGLTQSFNISVAVAVSLYALLSTGKYPEGSLTQEQRTELLGRWLLRDVKAAKPILRARAGLDLLDF